MAGVDVDWAGAADAQEKALKQMDGLSVGSRGALDTAQSDKISVAEKSLLQKVIRKSLVENKNDLEIQRKDPNCPLYSVKSFEELNLQPNLLKGVYAMGFNAPSKIQEMALPTLLADPPQNMIAQSQSGTGKTAAFVLAMLSRVNTDLKHPQVLCLSPTYELALQIGEVASKMSQFCPDLTIRYAVRGEEVARGSRIHDNIIIGTPGKVLDWSLKFKFFDLNKIIVFVLDEADVMIATQGHQDQSIRIHKNLGSHCQMLLFSATYDQAVMDFAENIVSNPVTIKLRREEESLDNIKQVSSDPGRCICMFVFLGVRGLPDPRGQVPLHCEHLWRDHHRPGHDLLPHAQDGQLAGGEDDGGGARRRASLRRAHRRGEAQRARPVPGRPREDPDHDQRAVAGD
jgi:ATP-dependent RNA helicase DDX19/DBP5